MPSKTTISESKYEPKCSDSSLPNDYVPSKEKCQKNQYVPEGSTSVENEVMYKPSDKSSLGETPYQPNVDNIVADYIPTKKSATNSSNHHSWLDKDQSKWTEFDFISSEIEMMKKLLSEDEKPQNVQGGIF